MPTNDLSAASNATLDGCGLAVADFVNHADGQGRGEDGAAPASGIVETEEGEAGLDAESPMLIQLPVNGLGEAEGEGRLGGDAVPVGKAGDDAAG